MGHIVNKGPSDPVSVRHIHSTNEDRKRDFKEFKDRKVRESKIKDERFAAIRKRQGNRSGGSGRGINIDSLKY